MRERKRGKESQRVKPNKHKFPHGNPKNNWAREEQGRMQNIFGREKKNFGKIKTFFVP